MRFSSKLPRNPSFCSWDNVAYRTKGRTRRRREGLSQPDSPILKGMCAGVNSLENREIRLDFPGQRTALHSMKIDNFHPVWLFTYLIALHQLQSASSLVDSMDGNMLGQLARGHHKPASGIYVEAARHSFGVKIRDIGQSPRLPVNRQMRRWCCWPVRLHIATCRLG